MSLHLKNELEEVKKKVLDMSDIAVETIQRAVNSLKNSEIESAQKVVRDDTILDDLEVEIDHDCIRLLVTQQPAASDLRFILAILKINTDIERIGDLAVNIARETIRLDGKPALKPLVDIPRMAGTSIRMIQDSLLAMTDKDAALARKVIEMDAEIDELNIQIYRELFSFMAEHPSTISEALGLIMVAKALERIGDHATNIAERVIYFIEGVDVRHDFE